MTVRASNEFQRNLKTLHVQPSTSSLKRPRSPSTEPICSPEYENSPDRRAQDVNQNPVKMRCRPALDRAMSIISNRGRDHHQHHQCYFCGTIFPNAEVLQAHRKMPHSYNCDECPRRFATRSELDRHNLHPEGLVISSSSSDSSKCLYPAVEEGHSREKSQESADKLDFQQRMGMTFDKSKIVKKLLIIWETGGIEEFELFCKEEFFASPTYKSELMFDGSYKVTVSVDGTEAVGTGDTEIKSKAKACRIWMDSFSMKNFQKSWPDIITLSDDEEEKNDNEASSNVPLRATTAPSTCISDLTGDITKEDQASSHDVKEATKSNDHLQVLSDCSYSYSALTLTQSPVPNSHDHSGQDSSCSPGFLQTSNTAKDKVCGDQDSKEFNDFLEGVVTISSESDSDRDSYDEAPELKMSSDDTGSYSSGFSFRPSPWHFPPKSRHLSKREEDDSESESSVSSGFHPSPSKLSRLQIKKEEGNESDSSGFLQKSPLPSPQLEKEEGEDLKRSSDDSESESSVSSDYSGFLQKSQRLNLQFLKEEGDDLPNIEPKIEIEENYGAGNDQEYRENDAENNQPQDENQNQSNNGDVTDKCVQCGIHILRSNFASSNGGELKCFQCQPQVFFKTPCPICDEEVDNVNMQYHLEHAHHDVFVYPCKMCQVMIGKHDIIPHMKVCGENGGKPKVLCPLCKKDMLKTSLALHMQTHMNRPKQQCPHCDSKVLDLKMHIKRKHSGF